MYALRVCATVLSAVCARTVTVMCESATREQGREHRLWNADAMSVHLDSVEDTGGAAPVAPVEAAHTTFVSARF